MPKLDAETIAEAGMSKLDVLMESLRDLKEQLLPDAFYRYETLLAVEVWAREQLPIKEEDHVRIKEGFTPNWAGRQEMLCPGATAKVHEIHFNAVHKYWCALIRLDDEWWSREGETERHTIPEKDRGLYPFSVKWLERVEEVPNAAT